MISECDTIKSTEYEKVEKLFVSSNSCNFLLIMSVLCHWHELLFNTHTSLYNEIMLKEMRPWETRQQPVISQLHVTDNVILVFSEYPGLKTRWCNKFHDDTVKYKAG